MADRTPHVLNYRARPSREFPHGVAELSDYGTEVVCDALWFPTEEEAVAWAVSRGWKSYVKKTAVMAVDELATMKAGA